MIELVLHDPCRDPVELQLERIPIDVDAFERYRYGPFDRNPDLTERKASFVVDVGLGVRLGDSRIGDGPVLTVEGADDESPNDANLVCGKPDAVGLVHEARHPIGKLPELLVERLDLPCAHPQRRIAVLPDLAKRTLTTDRALGVRAFLCFGLEVVVISVTVTIVIVVVLVVVNVAHRGDCNGLPEPALLLRMKGPLQALRVDIDHGGDLVTPQRRRRGREETRDLLRDPARLGRLCEELCAMATAQA